MPHIGPLRDRGLWCLGHHLGLKLERRKVPLYDYLKKTAEERWCAAANFDAAVKKETIRMNLTRNLKLLGGFAMVLLAFGSWRLFMPDEYEASSLLVVDPPRLPESYLPSATGMEFASRLSGLKAGMMSGTRLGHMIDTLGLYKSLKGHKTELEIIDRMRSKIRLEIVRDFDGLPVDKVRAVRISYRGDEPRLVAQVCNQLAANLIDEYFRQREQQAMGTIEFVEEQLRLAKKALQEAEESASTPKPKGEQAVAALELSALHDNYVSLLKKKLEAESVVSLEMRQKGEKLEILDPAMPPKEPINKSNFLASAW